ncbi:MAG: tRNA (5-methylaminomethyl-2-thiouridine)(34)-methyltransferase MnmD [Chitinivibrionia bacterium]|nr:tRNA (5-methylaminomethyl-2-thiouridine)(34)-methyltransferase MnmD [Chitinivibrionia bacterium]
MSINPIYDDCYFSNENGFEESKSVFVFTNEIVEKIKKSANLTIGELGFGTGLNLLATLYCLQGSDVEKVEIQYYSVEKYPLPKTKIDEILFEYSKKFPENYVQFLEYYDELFCNIKSGFNFAVWLFGKIKINFNLYFGDVFDFLNELDVKIDCWYLDGHSPDKNPEMWSESVCKKVYEKSKISATAATYTACGSVKRNLRAAGFFVKRRKGFGKKRHKLFVEKLFFTFFV